jgi:hypothetical protein
MTTTNEAALRAEIERLRGELDKLLAAICDKADRQEAFAGPEYTQHDDAARKMFRHAAKMLRDLLPKGGGG